ncbi:hypothetical protein [Mycolicibacterium sp.]|uniref:hypothetical protein n=1 Tax=Mycolicibacterium sp. TaxID=2320850 RepID=UPI00355DA653
MSFAVVKGERLRITKTNSCGRPIPGAANQLVTEGFIRANLDPNMKEAEDLTSTNAAGKECVVDRTPAERRWWNTELQLCDVDPDVFSLLASWTRLLGPDGKPIGVRDRASVDADFGVAIEVWTGGKSDDDCPEPEDDASFFSAPASGRQYGYLFFVANEFVSSALTVEASPSTFTMTGRTVAPKHWFRGPYNVAAIDTAGTPGRLLVPAYDKDDDNHVLLFRTPVAPPEPTDGAVPLAVESIFVAPDYYVAGPGGEPAADVAPAQPTVPAGGGGGGGGEGEG